MKSDHSAHCYTDKAKSTRECLIIPFVPRLQYPRPFRSPPIRTFFPWCSYHFPRDYRPSPLWRRAPAKVPANVSKYIKILLFGDRIFLALIKERTAVVPLLFPDVLMPLAKTILSNESPALVEMNLPEEMNFEIFSTLTVRNTLHNYRCNLR